MKHILVALGALALLAGVASGQAGAFDRYVGSGTAVLKADGSIAPAFDEGALVCNKSTGLPSVGGGCVLFGAWDSVAVSDALETQVAFQVCLDHNGDGLCGGNQDAAGLDPCGDDIFYSHDDAGNFFNPLGPLPTAFREGCPGGPWPGYAVFLCEGVHGNGDGTGTPHRHGVTQGVLVGTTGGTGFGDFCAPPANSLPKAYRVQ